MSLCALNRTCSPSTGKEYKKPGEIDFILWGSFPEAKVAGT